MNAIERHAARALLTVLILPMMPILLILLMLLAGSGGAAAAAPEGKPTVAQVLAACERGAAKGNKGMDADNCKWFAAPCGCHPGHIGSETYRWCTPVTESTETTLGKVVAELRRVPDRSAPIDQVVPVILARLNPCQPGGDD